MSEKTHTEIIAGMRREADADICLGHGMEGILKRNLADDLESAHKRERGDCAKLREALEHMVRAETYGSMERDDLCGRCLEKMFARCKHDGTCWVDKAITALAAPPRNCDLPEVAKDPWRAWLDDKSNWDEFGSPKLEIHDWLLAPATEKEGGAK